jgi:hypothetical protein
MAVPNPSSTLAISHQPNHCVAEAIAQWAGDGLQDAPHRGIDRFKDADALDAKPEGREEQGKYAPAHAVIEVSTEKATPRDFQYQAGSCHSVQKHSARKVDSKFDRDQTIENAVSGAFDRLNDSACHARTIIELNARNVSF